MTVKEHLIGLAQIYQKLDINKLYDYAYKYKNEPCITLFKRDIL